MATVVHANFPTGTGLGFGCNEFLYLNQLAQISSLTRPEYHLDCVFPTNRQKDWYLSQPNRLNNYMILLYLLLNMPKNAAAYRIINKKFSIYINILNSIIHNMLSRDGYLFKILRHLSLWYLSIFQSNQSGFINLVIDTLDIKV